MKKRFAFLAGLPRTGSTVLGTLLSQHPDLHPTRTSCLRDLICYVRGFNLGESPYFDVKDPQSPLWGIAKGMLHGAYEHIAEEIVVEKDRGWAGDVALIRKITGCEPQILSPVRSIPEIIASFMLISRKIGKQSKIEDEVRLANRESNAWTLSRVIWERYIYTSWKVFKAGYETNPECFLLLEYDDIVNKPKKTMGLICTYLDVSPHAPSTTGLKNPNPENDSVYGMPGLHDVKSELKRTSPPAWEVLGDECYEFWASKNLEFWRDGNG
jgi:sulfotransferase